MKILLKSPIIAHRTRLSTKLKYGRHHKSAVKPDFRMIGVRISESVLYIYRGRYRISRKGGRGVSRVWIFHTWTFCSGTYCAVHGQNTGGQNASRNCKGEQNAGHFMGQGG